MRILTSAAVFGLVAVPPTSGEQLGTDCNLEHFDGADPAQQDAPESTPPKTPSVCAKLGRALRWLVGISSVDARGRRKKFVAAVWPLSSDLC